MLWSEISFVLYILKLCFKLDLNKSLSWRISSLSESGYVTAFIVVIIFNDLEVDYGYYFKICILALYDLFSFLKICSLCICQFFEGELF